MTTVLRIVRSRGEAYDPPVREHEPLRRRLAAVTALSLTCGCGGDAQPTTDSAGTTGAATTDTSTTSGLTSVELTTEPTTHASDTEVSPEVSCECAAPDGLNYWLGSYDAAACGWGPCGSIEFDSEVLDVEALDCALEMLIAGTPGLVHHELSGTQLYEGGFVRIAADRRGLSRTWEQEDLGCTTYPLEMIQLKEPDYFAGCKALADPRDRYACLRDWSAGPLGEVCIEQIDCSRATDPASTATTMSSR